MFRHLASVLSLLLLAGCAFAQDAPPAQPAGDDRPNIVIIMADDLGYADLSCYGNDRYQTPHLDAMAAGGMRFTDFHSNGSVCSPTRAALLTGRYQQRSGLSAVVKSSPKHWTHNHGLQLSEFTIADAMKQAGYRTGLIGKWHLGYKPQYNPIHQGFDVFRGYISGNIDFHSHVDEANTLDWWNQDRIEDEPGYVTDLINKHAVHFVKANKDAPFFLYIAHQSPHYPYQGPNDAVLRTVDGMKKRAPEKQIPRAYREMMESMDRGVGELLRVLKEEGLAENTLVFFVSDNGPTKHGNKGSLRARKGHVFEGGHRVPGIAYWPGRIEPGVESDALVMTFDLMPTAMALAGVETPDGLTLDGQDLLPLLEGRAQAEPRVVFWGQKARWAMRDGPWKFVRVTDNNKLREYLFHLGNDLSEANDLSADEPSRADQMREALDRWIEEVEVGATVQPDNPGAIWKK
ncbi:MAG: sulfatase [Planctomycetota bacterium]